MKIRGSLSRAEIDDYLDEATVPIRLACHTPAGRLWMLSLWFQHRDGVFRCATGADADVVRYLGHDPSVAFEVSTNEPPYAGVRGSGTATVDPDPEKAVLRELLERYLGGTDSKLARSLLEKDRTEVTITVDPGVVYGWDFSERMADAVE
ncbi:pyridoxamine 5'-phosphate oxidase family protein [Natronosalvus halobius]|uniref:pyridoxamine 5'-phosphate oxidase family protein n=1 Tax=Natronosalvus halobius TaxID=2953746 RepID=UPI00209E9DA1|nr:pyridoxamine 5'-phosphate oxidase family protein [Natronosalvus halobius]USZ73115.1 pyridoxamine 5'-phosphate oxidase family protein [Natronosalvus halobius]